MHPVIPLILTSVSLGATLSESNFIAAFVFGLAVTMFTALVIMK